ncbi:hypothetical protein D8B26_007792 [Coccidioides posadasii str. Silveira]|nr:hypothetical protein D8B26_007792 [Coccidioides posadasii str. Silveira]
MAAGVETVAQPLSNSADGQADHNLSRLVGSDPPAADEIHASNSVKSGSGLGVLEIFPLEILHMILSGLDITTLTNFRAASQDAKIVVESISKYTSIYKLAPSVFRAVVSFGAGSWITCEDLRGALSSTSCAACGGPGSFIYLFSCERVCPECITRGPEYPTALAGFARFLCDLDNKTLGELRTITIPERDACPDMVHRPLELVNRNDALNAGIRLHGPDSLFSKISDGESDEEDTDSDYGDRIELEEGSSLATESTASSEKADLISGVTFYAGAVRAPQVNFAAGYVEWGVCCSSCRNSGRIGREKMKWDEDGAAKYADYLRECNGAMTILSCLDYCQHVARSAAVGYVPMVNEEERSRNN